MDRANAERRLITQEPGDFVLRESNTNGNHVLTLVAAKPSGLPVVFEHHKLYVSPCLPNLSLWWDCGTASTRTAPQCDRAPVATAHSHSLPSAGCFCFLLRAGASNRYKDAAGSYMLNGNRLNAACRTLTEVVLHLSQHMDGTTALLRLPSHQDMYGKVAVKVLEEPDFFGSVACDENAKKAAVEP